MRTQAGPAAGRAPQETTSSSRIRPLERDDLAAVARLYADFVDWGVETLPQLEAFYARVLLEHPFADPELPSFVYDDPVDGVVGVICSHARRFVHDGRALRVGCPGPLMIARGYRRNGLGSLLTERYLEGPQDVTLNDRAIDPSRVLWESLGGSVDYTASVGWAHAIRPAARLARGIARRLASRDEVPAEALLARLDEQLGRRLRPAPPSASSEPLTNAALLDLLPRVGAEYRVCPAYDDAFLTWLFAEMEDANVAGGLVRRLVRDGEGRPIGWFVMYLAPHGIAEVVQVAAAPADVWDVFGQLVHDAARQGATELRGRVEPHLLPTLRSFRCRLVSIEWSLVHARDSELMNAILAGRALIARLDGEWWIRPRPPEGADAAPPANRG